VEAGEHAREERYDKAHQRATQLQSQIEELIARSEQLTQNQNAKLQEIEVLSSEYAALRRKLAKARRMCLDLTDQHNVALRMLRMRQTQKKNPVLPFLPPGTPGYNALKRYEPRDEFEVAFVSPLVSGPRREELLVVPDACKATTETDKEEMGMLQNDTVSHLVKMAPSFSVGTLRESGDSLEKLRAEVARGRSAIGRDSSLLTSASVPMPMAKGGPSHSILDPPMVVREEPVDTGRQELMPCILRSPTVLTETSKIIRLESRRTPATIEAAARLPVSVIDRICKYLSVRDLNNAQRVCSTWNLAIACSTAWRTAYRRWCERQRQNASRRGSSADLLSGLAERGVDLDDQKTKTIGSGSGTSVVPHEQRMHTHFLLRLEAQDGATSSAPKTYVMNVVSEDVPNTSCSATEQLGVNEEADLAAMKSDPSHLLLQHTLCTLFPGIHTTDVAFCQSFLDIHSHLMRILIDRTRLRAEMDASEGSKAALTKRRDKILEDAEAERVALAELEQQLISDEQTVQLLEMQRQELETASNEAAVKAKQVIEEAERTLAEKRRQLEIAEEAKREQDKQITKLQKETRVLTKELRSLQRQRAEQCAYLAKLADMLRERGVDPELALEQTLSERKPTGE